MNEPEPRDADLARLVRAVGRQDEHGAPRFAPPRAARLAPRAERPLRRLAFAGLGLAAGLALLGVVAGRHPGWPGKASPRETPLWATVAIGSYSVASVPTDYLLADPPPAAPVRIRDLVYQVERELDE